MKTITGASLINSKIERYKESYKLMNISMTEEDIAKITSDCKLIRNTCDECKRESEVTVQIGEELDYESSTAQICLECLEKAVFIAKKSL